MLYNSAPYGKLVSHPVSFKGSSDMCYTNFWSSSRVGEILRPIDNYFLGLPEPCWVQLPHLRSFALYRSARHSDLAQNPGAVFVLEVLPDTTVEL